MIYENQLFFNEIKYWYLKSGQEGIQSKVLLISDKLGHQGVGTKTGSEQWRDVMFDNLTSM